MSIKNSKLILYKTPKKIIEELRELESHAKFRYLKISKSPEYDLPEEMGKRQFLIIEKE